MPTNHAARRSITSRINKLLSDYGVENAVSGGKFDELRQEVSSKTGYWKHSSVISKPSRLIVHFARQGDVVVATLPSENTNGNFAYANTANRLVGGLSIRILPVIKVDEQEFRSYPDWEWLLWYCFSPSLERGSSGQLFEGFEPASGKFIYRGYTQPYIASGLVTLNAPTEAFVDAEHELRFTYLDATKALRDLIRVAPTPPTSTGSAEEEDQPNA